MAYSPTTWVEPGPPYLSAANLNKIETALTKMPYGPDGTVGQVPAADGSGAFTWQKIGNAQVASNAAIDASKLAGYPADVSKVLRGNGTWAVPGSNVVARKTTSKTISNTSPSGNDLFNGEFTVAANALGATGTCRVTAWGDWVQNSGGATGLANFLVRLGATPTTAINTGVSGSSAAANSSSRMGWRIVFEIMNSATNVQWVTFQAVVAVVLGTAGGAAFTTGEGRYVTSGTSTFGTATAIGAGATAVDTTADMAVTMPGLLASSTSSDITLQGAIMEIL